MRLVADAMYILSVIAKFTASDSRAVVIPLPVLPPTFGMSRRIRPKLKSTFIITQSLLGM